MKSRRKTLLIQVLALLLVTVVFNTSMMPQGVMASEEENIDSFDVHPANRWTVTNTGFTATVAYSLLNASDVGDNSIDTYGITRDLRSLDAKVVVRFKFDIDGGGDDYDRLWIGLYGNDDNTNMIDLYLYGLNDASYATTRIAWRDQDSSTYRYTTLSGTERLVDNTWYVCELKIKTLESQFNIKVKVDNGTKVFEYDEADLFSTYRPELFVASKLTLRLDTGVKTTGVKIDGLWDYVKAPFKEREWKPRTGYTPSDSDWLDDRWDLARVQDDINDDSMWTLTVPYLDTVSGMMSFRWENETLGIDDGDMAAMGFALYAVDANDGDLHEVFLLVIYQLRSDIAGGPDWGTFIEIYEDGVKTQENYTNHNGFPLYEQPAVSFSISLSEDRSKAALKTRSWIDVDEQNDYYDYVAEIDISDCADDPSQEFVLMTYYVADFDADNEWIALVEDFGFSERDIFADIVNAILEPIGNFLSVIFTLGFRFLAGIFKFVGDAISAAIVTMQTALASLLTTIAGTLTSIGVDIGSILADVASLATDIGNYVASFAGDIASAIWDGIGSALDFITDAIADTAADVWAALEPVVSDIVSWITAVASDVADFLFAVVEFLITLLITIAIDIFELLAAIAFAVWDALGLPDLLAVLDFVTAGFIGLVTDGLAALEWLADVVAFWSWGMMFIGLVIFWLVPVLRSRGEFGEFAESFYMMNSWNIMPFSVLGFEVHVPVGVVFWPVFFLFLAAAAVV